MTIESASFLSGSSGLSALPVKAFSNSLRTAFLPLMPGDHNVRARPWMDGVFSGGVWISPTWLTNLKLCHLCSLLTLAERVKESATA